MSRLFLELHVLSTCPYANPCCRVKILGDAFSRNVRFGRGKLILVFSCEYVCLETFYSVLLMESFDVLLAFGKVTRLPDLSGEIWLARSCCSVLGRYLT